jgi:hypothetical protein
MSDRGRASLFGRPGELLVDEHAPRIQMPAPPPAVLRAPVEKKDENTEDILFSVDTPESEATRAGPLRVFVGPPAGRREALPVDVRVPPPSSRGEVGQDTLPPGTFLPDAVDQLGDVLGRRSRAEPFRVGASRREGAGRGDPTRRDVLSPNPFGTEPPLTDPDAWAGSGRPSDPAGESPYQPVVPDRFDLSLPEARARPRGPGIPTAAARSRQAAVERRGDGQEAPNDPRPFEIFDQPRSPVERASSDRITVLPPMDLDKPDPPARDDPRFRRVEPDEPTGFGAVRVPPSTSTGRASRTDLTGGGGIDGGSFMGLERASVTVPPENLRTPTLPPALTEPASFAEPVPSAPPAWAPAPPPAPKVDRGAILRRVPVRARAPLVAMVVLGLLAGAAWRWELGHPGTAAALADRGAAFVAEARAGHALGGPIATSPLDAGAASAPDAGAAALDPVAAPAGADAAAASPTPVPSVSPVVPLPASGSAEPPGTSLAASPNPPPTPATLPVAPVAPTAPSEPWPAALPVADRQVVSLKAQPGAYQPATGLLQVVCDRRATIYVDGVRKGRTDEGRPIELTAGAHQVRVNADGRVRSREVRVDSGELRMVEFRLNK